MSHWYVYMVCCVDGTLYSGVTTDLVRRVDEHNSNKVGAKYTKTRRPVSLVYQKRCKNRSYAQKAEAKLKQLSRQEKQKLVDKI